MAEDWQKSLQEEVEQLRADKKALQSELHVSGGIKTDAVVVKQALIEKVPDYIAQIDSLALSADNESVRLSANKLLIEWALTTKLDPSSIDPNNSLRDLLTRIQPKKKVR